jgi:ATP-dependent RNA helicase DDX6/DHH1
VLEALIAKCPPDRQICLFSATFPVTVKGFKQKFLPNAYIINLMDELTLRGISQFYAFVEERQKVTLPTFRTYKLGCSTFVDD